MCACLGRKHARAIINSTSLVFVIRRLMSCSYSLYVCTLAFACRGWAIDWAVPVAGASAARVASPARHLACSRRTSRGSRCGTGLPCYLLPLLIDYDAK